MHGRAEVKAQRLWKLIVGIQGGVLNMRIEAPQLAAGLLNDTCQSMCN
jgi:hypothetical protein